MIPDRQLSRFFCLLALSSSAGLTQIDRGSLTGTILDASRRTIAGASVTAASSSGEERRTHSTAQGVYQLADLPIGSWTVTFSAPGFRGIRYEAIEQIAGQTRTLNPVLSVAGSSNQLTIAAPAIRLDQSSATLGNAVEQRAVQELPLNGRNWTSLTLLAPGAIDQGGSTQRSIRFTGRGRDEMNVTFDGVDATGIVNQAQKAYVRLAIPISAIAEFQVESVLPTAEYGDAGGAQISVVSPSGANLFHGSLFEYFRNSDFDARSPFDQTRGPLPFHLNQFGGSFGGPVRRNQTFFFIDHEQIHQVQDQTLIGFVPTAAARSLVATQSPALAPLLNAYPAGNGTISGGVQQWNGVGRLTDSEYSEMIRLDHRVSDVTTLYARFSYDNAATVAPLGVLTDRQLSSSRPLNSVVEMLHVFSPTLVNEAKFGTNQLVSHTFNLTQTPYTVNVSGFSPLNTSESTNQDGRTFSWLDNISLVHGRNVFKAGVEIRRVGINEGNSFYGTLTYNSLANFQANSLDSATYIGVLPLKRMRKTSYFGYVQNEWKLRPNLTVNAGLRYEFYNDFHETTGRAAPFDLQSCGGFCPPGSAFLFPAKDNFDPRLGLAWSPDRLGGNTVLRAGYGIYHEDAQLDDQNFPTANDEPRYSLTRGSQFPNLTYPFDAMLATATGAFSPKDQIRRRKDTYVQQWSASLQQSLPGKLIGTVAYIGNKGTDIMNRSYINILNPLTASRPLPQYGQIELRAKDGNSQFNALQVSVKRYLAQGWLLTGNYMWAHAINDGSLGSGVEDVFPQNVSCRACERASSDQDARQSFSAASVYELPFGNGHAGILRALASGWQLSSVASGRTGLPVNITVDRSAAVLPDGNAGNQRPNLIAGIPLTPAGGSTPAHWINPAALAVPASGTWGNLGRNAFRGPALWQVDVALQRRIVLHERVALTARAEMFNVFNRAQYGNPLADISAPSSFGRITSLVNTSPVGSGTPRQMELALRLVF